MIWVLNGPKVKNEGTQLPNKMCKPMTPGLLVVGSVGDTATHQKLQRLNAGFTISQGFEGTKGDLPRNDMVNQPSPSYISHV